MTPPGRRVTIHDPARHQEERHVTQEQQQQPAVGWVASTPVEGIWRFTLADTPEQAMDNLLQAIVHRRVLCYPNNNPITAVRVPHD